VSLFIISIFSLISCIYYKILGTTPIKLDVYGNELLHLFESLHPFDILLPFVCSHACIDFFINKSYELKLHHVFVTIPAIYYFFYEDKNISSIISYSLLKTEFSSLFYVLKFYLQKKSIAYNINNILFYLTFFKFRIIDMYNELIYSNIIYNHVIDTSSITRIIPSIGVFIAVNGLYLLNVYWFFIINKILYKSIAKTMKIDTDSVCHYMCSYIYWVNIPLSIYIYSHNPREKNILDIIGVTALSISSYYYHDDIYKRLKSQKITEYNIPNQDNAVFFINDNFFINLRAFLIVATNYYYHPYFLQIITISGFFHMISMYNIIINLFELIVNPEDVKHYFLNLHNIYNAFPIAVDVILICSNSPNDIAIPFLFIHIAMALLFYIEPFYKLTHVVFHLCLITQNYYVCKSSIQT
jgi:hypothetical protein